MKKILENPKKLITIGADCECTLFDSMCGMKIPAEDVCDSRYDTIGYDHDSIAEVRPDYVSLDLDKCKSLESTIRDLFWSYVGRPVPVYSHPFTRCGSHIHIGLYRFKELYKDDFIVEDNADRYMRFYVRDAIEPVLKLNSAARLRSEYSSLGGYRLCQNDSDTLEVRAVPTGVFLYRNLFGFISYSLGLGMLFYQLGFKKLTKSVMSILYVALYETIDVNLSRKWVCDVPPIIEYSKDEIVIPSSCVFRHARKFNYKISSIDETMKFVLPENFDERYIYTQCWLLTRDANLKKYEHLLDVLYNDNKEAIVETIREIAYDC